MHATQEKNIENVNGSNTQDTLRNCLDLLSVSVSKPLAFGPDFNPHNCLECKIICKDPNGKDLYINNFRGLLMYKAKDFWGIRNEISTLEMHIIDSINLDYLFALYNVHKTFLFSSFIRPSSEELLALQNLQQIVCLKILQDCIVKKQPTSFMERNNLFKIFSDFAKDCCQIIDLEFWNTQCSPSTLTQLKPIDIWKKIHFITFVEMTKLLEITLKPSVLFHANAHHHPHDGDISSSISTYLQNTLQPFPLGDFFHPLEKMFNVQKNSQGLKTFNNSTGDLHFYAFSLLQQMRGRGMLNSQTTFKEYSINKTTILREYDINQLQLYHLHALVFWINREANITAPSPHLAQQAEAPEEIIAPILETYIFKGINHLLSAFVFSVHFHKSDASFILAAYNILQKIQDSDLQSMIGKNILDLSQKLKIDANPNLGDSLFNEDQAPWMNAFFWFPPSAQEINYHKKAMKAFLLSIESTPSTNKK
jgi:hypothetical protein